MRKVLPTPAIIAHGGNHGAHGFRKSYSACHKQSPTDKGNRRRSERRAELAQAIPSEEEEGAANRQIGGEEYQNHGHQFVVKQTAGSYGQYGTRMQYLPKLVAYAMDKAAQQVGEHAENREKHPGKSHHDIGFIA